MLIWYLRGNEKAAQFLNALGQLKVSAVSYMELVQGCRNKQELERLKKDFSLREVEVLPISERVCDRAVSVVEAHFLGDGLTLADALIAAAALERQLPIATANTKHYQRIEGLKIEAFVP